ncbi:hypothetical protein D5086_006477 [Populus alba]|uniref:Uncharacterized protein n=1 Tax=Populus alba TaxID=43335 RepID=A0ACC4CKM2_POPAL
MTSWSHGFIDVLKLLIGAFASKDSNQLLTKKFRFRIPRPLQHHIQEVHVESILQHSGLHFIFMIFPDTDRSIFANMERKRYRCTDGNESISYSGLIYLYLSAQKVGSMVLDLDQVISKLNLIAQRPLRHSDLLSTV